MVDCNTLVLHHFDPATATVTVTVDSVIRRIGLGTG